MSDALIQLLTAFIGALGFSLVFNVRRELLLSASLGGMLVWGVYLFCGHFFEGVFLPSLVAAAFASLYSEILARVKKAPATVFYTPALIPLVPGGSLYYTMSYAIRGEWESMSLSGSSTAYCALGIAVGMSLVLSTDFTLRKIIGKLSLKEKLDQNKR